MKKYDLLFFRKNFLLKGNFKKNRKNFNSLKLKIYLKNGKLNKDIKKSILNHIDFKEYKLKRSRKSIYNEIVAHLVLDKLGLFKKHNEIIDIDENESLTRRICYFIIAKIGVVIIWEK